MKHSIDCAQQIRGTYWHAAAILKLELDPIVRVPLEELRFRVGGGAITRRVAGDVGPMETERDRLRVPLRWQAAEHPRLFPVMDADLRISDAGGNHIELRVVGQYHPPLGAVGAIADVAAGHRVAESSIQAFLADVAQRLEAKLVEHATRADVKP
jgi:hypothetical protein